MYLVSIDDPVMAREWSARVKSMLAYGVSESRYFAGNAEGHMFTAPMKSEWTQA